MRCIAHRGFAGGNPENTISAVESAATAGADAVEVDARRCGSGEVVVIHDPTVDRVTDGTGAVAEHSLSELRALDVLSAGETVPTLGEVFSAVPGEVTVNVELKETGLAADALAVANAHENDVLVSSFEPAVLREARAVGTAPLAALFAEDPETATEEARRLGCRAVHPHWRLCDAAFVARAHDAGFDVNAWTVRSDRTAGRVASAGADGLIADACGYCRGSSRS
jgi:glycerophosphoryl diester phosphodiesterase